MVEHGSNVDWPSDDPSEARHHGGCADCGTGTTAGVSTQCGNDLEKVYPATAIRFGYMRYIGEFSHPPDMRFTCRAKVVIQTQRGIEIGEQVPLTCTGCERSITRDQIQAWIQTSGEDTYLFNAGRILREATAADLAEYSRIQAQCREKREFAQQVADRRNLPLSLVECECPFGGERIIFYFTAAERVDFRAMVKDLAREYRTRIEMRQIGARDEARLLADFETCGREVCCKVFLKTLKPISMRMAKLQKATLDPSQVSGRCGRLKCCLRYEHKSYEQLDKQLPRLGVRIRTSHGEGVIVNRQLLTQLVQIRLDSDVLVTVVAEDITDVDVPRPTRQDDSPVTAPTDSGTAEQGRSGSPRTGPKRARPEAGEPSAESDTKSDHKEQRPSSPPGRASEKRGDEQPSARRRRRRRKRRRGRGGSSEPSG